MPSEQARLDLITRLVSDINEVKDMDLLLERILSAVRRLLNADAGCIYVKEGETLHCSQVQNDTLNRRSGKDRRFSYNTFSARANNGSVAGYAAKHNRTVNIPDVYDLDPSAPYTFDRSHDRATAYRTRSMLTVPINNHRGEVLAVLEAVNALDPGGRVVPFSASDEGLVLNFAASAALALERAHMTRSLILRMISMAELRDPAETGPHANRVGAYSAEIYEEWAKRRGLPPDQIETEKDALRMAAMLHDVGKVAISDLILKKPSPLDINEFETIKSHTYLGARLFRDMSSDFDEIATEVAMNHHERWDGKGYPGFMDPSTKRPMPGFEMCNGLPRPKKGEEIPLFGRIVAVADVYDALSSARSYKERWDEDRVLHEIERSAGTQFDPEVVESFFGCLDVMKAAGTRYPDPK
ncbi:MAG: HD domain-containing phosphohydrolase [Desulfobacteraceae bacterium]